MAEVSLKPTASKARSKGEKVVQPAADEAARDVVTLGREAAEAGLASMGDGSPLGPLGAVAANTTDITDQLEKGGPAFGSFVKSIGLAVAEAQQKLDETLVTTAKALSETQIDVIAVFEQQINDEDGSMSKGVPHVQKLPLVNYLMPTAYAWSRVHLESDMQVSEYSATTGFNIQGRSQSFSSGVSGSYGLWGGGIRGHVAYGQSSYSAGAESSAAVNQSAGSMHMEATLEPRGDIRLPQPFITQKGPQLKVLVQSVEPIEEEVPGVNGAQPTKKRVGTRARLKAELKKSTGDPHEGKSLEFSCSQPTVTYKLGNGGKTGSDGTIEITLERSGPAYGDGSPLQAVTRIWFGLVTETVPVTL